MVYFRANYKIEMVQGWSTNCVTNVHRNRIVLHQVGAAFVGNARPMCNAFGLFRFSQI